MSQISKQIGGGSDPSNLIINGHAYFYQRAPGGVTGATSGIQAADRFGHYRGGLSSLIDNERISDGPLVGRVSEYSHRWRNDGASGALGAGDFRIIQYKVEGQHIRPFWQQNLTLSFWARASVAGKYGVTIQNVTTPNITSWLQEIELEANVWKFIEIPFNYDVETIVGIGGTQPSTTNGEGLVIRWTMSAGTNFHGSPTQDWQSGNLLSSSDQVNWTNTDDATFDLHGVMLNPGRVALPYRFFGHSMEDDFQAALRYYEKSYPRDVAFGSSSIGSGETTGKGTSGGVQTRLYPIAVFKAEKRIGLSGGSPSLQLWNHRGNLSQNFISPYNSDSNEAIVNTNVGTSLHELQGYIRKNPEAPFSSSNNYKFHWSVDVEF